VIYFVFVIKIKTVSKNVSPKGKLIIYSVFCSFYWKNIALFKKLVSVSDR